MDKIDVIILGAGVAGLGASLKARELGKESIIFEASSRAGGLLDNFQIQGFRFDNAVHLSFATEPQVRAIFDKTDYFTHPAVALSFEENRWLKHPVQNNLYPLPAFEKVELIKSFLNRPNLRDDSYESWLRHQYGDMISERYPIRYTRKYWGTPAAQLSTTWIGDRMRRAELSEILYGSFTYETPNTYYTQEMRYPKKGGYRSFIEGLIESANIQYDSKVIGIDVLNKIVELSNGQKFNYQTLISSIPLPELSYIAKDIPLEVFEASKLLVATSIDLVSVGFNKVLTKDLWFYIYDEDIYASRAYSPSIKSSDNAPEGCSSLQFEIYSRGVNSKYSKADIIENVIYALKKMKIAMGNDLIFTHLKHLRYGNVIFDRGMEKNRDLIRSYFLNNGVKTVGRFGEWDYLWSNQSFLSGYKACC